MERTMTLIIFLTLTVVGAALIIMYVAEMKDDLVNGMCDPDPACANKVNGQTFCSNSTTFTRCVLLDGCLRSTAQECACAEEGGVASCS